MLQSSGLNHLHSEQLFNEQLREAARERLARAAQPERTISSRRRLAGVLAGLAAVWRSTVRPSAHPAR